MSRLLYSHTFSYHFGKYPRNVITESHGRMRFSFVRNCYTGISPATHLTPLLKSSRYPLCFYKKKKSNNNKKTKANKNLHNLAYLFSLTKKNSKKIFAFTRKGKKRIVFSACPAARCRRRAVHTWKRVTRWAPPRNHLSMSAPSTQLWTVWASVLYLNLFCASVSKTYPKVNAYPLYAISVYKRIQRKALYFWRAAETCVVFQSGRNVLHSHQLVLHWPNCYILWYLSVLTLRDFSVALALLPTIPLGPRLVPRSFPWPTLSSLAYHHLNYFFLSFKVSSFTAPLTV